MIQVEDLVIVSFFTSVLSGMLGAGGGVLLLLVLLQYFTPVEALLVHATIQFFTNIHRVILLKNYVYAKMLPMYFLGSAAVFVFLKLINYQPTITSVLLLISLLTLLSYWRTFAKFLDIEKPGRSISCGFIAMGAQICAGVNGNVLDLFLLRSKLNRFEIVSTKSLLSGLGHAIKWIFYILAYPKGGDFYSVYWETILGCVIVGFLGTAIGRKGLQKLGEKSFRGIMNWMIPILLIVMWVKNWN